MNEDMKLHMELNKLEVANSEKMQLRQLKLEAFKLARDIKPQSTYNPMGGQMAPYHYSAKEFVQDAELIYASLIK